MLSMQRAGGGNAAVPIVASLYDSERGSVPTWPGNVRELINAVEHAIVLCRGNRIEAADLPETVRGPAGARPAVARPGSPAAASDLAPLFDLPLREARAKATANFERAYLEEQLRREKGRIGRTAERAGITTRSLYDKLKQHGLRKEDFR